MRTAVPRVPLVTPVPRKEPTLTRPKIAIVVTFFGRAPFWLPAFFLSCRANPDVRWLLYTDVELAADLPENVTWRRMQIPELDRRASDVLGTRIELRRSLRKICDLKLAYGLIFADDLRPFDFWACSDLDIVWGDIRRFVTDDLLHAHDIVSSRKNRLSGHFTLFRNTARTNRTLDLIPDLAEAMADPRYRHLDERELSRHVQDRLNETPADGWPRVYWRQELTTSAKYQRALGDGEADHLLWRGGRTFGVEGRELMYVHFHKLKADMRAIDFGFDDRPGAFTIDRTGFTVNVGARV